MSYYRPHRRTLKSTIRSLDVFWGHQFAIEILTTSTRWKLIGIDSVESHVIISN